MRNLISAIILLFWCVTSEAVLQIDVQSNNAILNWDVEPGANHYLVQSSLNSHDFSIYEEVVVTTNSYTWPMQGNQMFFRVIPVKNFVSITAKRTTFMPENGRLYIDSCYVTVEREGLEQAYRMIRSDREFVVKNNTKLTWKDQVFESKKSITTFNGDPSSNIDNGYFQFLGQSFDYLSWADANGWSVEDAGNKYIISNVTDTLVVDVATTLLTHRTSQYGEKTFKTEFIWQYVGGVPVLWHVNRLEYRADSLHQLIREEYSDWVINPEITINVVPDEYPDVSISAMPQFPLETEPILSNCPVRRYAEDFSVAMPVHLREQVSCSQCHVSSPQGFILLHGLSSSPSVLDPLEFFIQENFTDDIVYRPFMPHDFTVPQMIDSLVSRMSQFGAIQWMGIGHSQGGLVGRALAQSNILSQILVLASPQQGSPVAKSENVDYAMWIFDDLNSSLNSCDNWFGWVTDVFSDASSNLGSMRSEIGYILNCGSIPDLRPDSDFIADLNSDTTAVPHRTLKAIFDRSNPVKGLWAGATTNYEFPYPLEEMDNIRTSNFNTIQSNWNDWIDDCETWTWIDPINSLRHDLEQLESRWRDNVVEGVWQETRTEPFYTYHAPGTCFYCTVQPTCYAAQPEPPAREFYCESTVEQDGSILWCCDEEGGCNGLYRCYRYDLVVEVIYHENDGIVRTSEQDYGDGWPIDAVDHLSATRSTAFNQDIYETVQLWRP
ncbi:alpha/beta hydrolase [bacterium]|jgi:hypothetical protein|nr:alpha/beta hydrolase [bacterium]MBT4649385.1 alpha/beta hydrolase [bacterium]